MILDSDFDLLTALLAGFFLTLVAVGAWRVGALKRLLQGMASTWRQLRPPGRSKSNAFILFIAMHLPRRLVAWCGIRIVAHATTGQFSDTVVPELTAMEALERWETK